MIPRVRLSPFMQDVAVTVATSIVTILSLVIVTRLMAASLSTQAFGVYSLSRRLVSSVGVFASVLGLTLTRNLASTRDEDRRNAYVAAAAIAGLGPSLVAVGLGSAFADRLGEAVFRSCGYGRVLLSAIGLVAAMVVYSANFARHRGRGRMRVANVWQLWAMGVGPIVVAAGWAGTGRIDLVNWLMAAVMGAAAIPLAVEVWGAIRRPGSRNLLGDAVADTIRYGGPRVPGGLAVGALLAVGPVLAPYFGTLAEAGYLVAGQSILRVLEGGTSAFGVVALPKVASLTLGGNLEFLRRRVEDILAMTLHLGLILSWGLALWAPEIVEAWLGPQYAAAITVVRIILLAVVPYLAYALLRSVIDALDERAVNAHIAYISLATTLGLSAVLGALGLGVNGLAAAGAIGFSVLGGLSLRHLWRRLELIGPDLALRVVIPTNIGAAAVAYCLRAVLPAGWGAGTRLGAGVGVGLVLGAVYLAVLRASRVRWVSEVEARLFHRGSHL